MNDKHRSDRRSLIRIAAAIAAITLLSSCGSGSGTPRLPGGGSLSQSAKVMASDLNGNGLPEIVVSSVRSESPRVFAADTQASYFDASESLAGLANAIVSDAPSQGYGGVLPFGGSANDASLLIFEGAVLEEADGAPRITSIIPTPCEAGEVLWIEGKGFRTSTHVADVLFGGEIIEPIFVLARFLAVQVPPDTPAGNYEIAVRRDAQVSSSASVEVHAIATPIIDRVSPDPLVRGRFATVEGSHLGLLGEDVKVTIDGVASSSVIAFRDILFFLVPDSAEDGTLVIARGEVVSAPFAVTLTDMPALSITGLSPNTAPLGAIVTIEATGIDFHAASIPEVSLEGTALPVLGIGPDRIDVVIPSGTMSGGIVLRQGDSTSNAVGFTVRDRQAPQIASVAPDPIVPGGVMEVVGTDLVDLRDVGDGGPSGVSGATSVTVSGEETPFVFPTAGGLVVLLPFELTSGKDDVAVVVTVGETSSEPFTVSVADSN